MKLAEYFCGFEKKEGLWDERYYSSRALSELFYHLYYSNSKKFEKYLNDIELIGSIYDHYKFKDFREILDNLDEDKFLAQKELLPRKRTIFSMIIRTILNHTLYCFNWHTQMVKTRS